MKLKHTSTTFRHSRKPVSQEDPTVQRPDRRKLKGIYRSITSATDEVRAEGLASALQWYDSAWAWLQQDKKKKPLLTMESLKLVNDANKHRQHAHEHYDDLGIREQSLRHAIACYELAVKKPLPTKKVADLYDLLDKRKERLDKREQRLSHIYRKVLDELFEAFKPKNGRGETMKYRVSDAPLLDGGTEHRPRWVSKDLRTLNYTQEHAKWMTRTVRSEGWLGVLNEEVQWLAHLSLAKWDMDEEKLKVVNPDLGNAIKKLMENVRRYAVANPKFALRLVKGRRRKKVVV